MRSEGRRRGRQSEEKMMEKTERGEREADRVTRRGRMGGEGELVTESLMEHISIFLIIPLDQS